MLKNVCSKILYRSISFDTHFTDPCTISGTCLIYELELVLNDNDTVNLVG